MEVHCNCTVRVQRTEKAGKRVLSWVFVTATLNSPPATQKSTTLLGAIQVRFISPGVAINFTDNGDNEPPPQSCDSWHDDDHPQKCTSTLLAKDNNSINSSSDKATQNKMKSISSSWRNMNERTNLSHSCTATLL